MAKNITNEKLWQIITLLLMLLIGIMCIVGIINNLSILVTGFYFFSAAKLMLALLGIAIIFLYISKKQSFSWISMIFFFPQIIVFVERTFQSAHFFIQRPIFDLSVGLRFGIDLIQRKGLHQFNIMGFNIIAIIALFISFKIYGRLIRNINVYIK